MDNKFEEVLVCVLAEVGRGIPETKLWKLMYFCEADYYEQNRQLITGVPYFKNYHGATPDKNVIDKTLKRIANTITIERKTCRAGKRAKIYKTVKTSPDYKILTAAERTFIRREIEKYGHLSVSQIVLLAHRDAPYLGTNLHERIDFDLVDFRRTDEPAEEINPSVISVPRLSEHAARRLLSHA